MAIRPVVHVIDDDQPARDALAFLLQCHEIETRTYDSAVRFLAAIDRIEHGCIVTDIRMPEMSGIELVKRLHGLGISDPVIVITGHADVQLAIQALHEGVSDFIEKPFSDDAILAAIHTAFEKRSSRARIEDERDRILKKMAGLSMREGEVMEGLLLGKANKVIAYDLGISARTVEVYRANVMIKLEARTLPELVRMVTIARLT